MKMKYLPLLLFLLCFADSASINAWPVHGAPSNITSPLGVNLSTDFGNQQADLNIVHYAGAWGFGSSGLNGTLTDLSLDANGWPYSSTVGYSGSTYTDGLGLDIPNTNNITNWTVFCNGGSTVEVGSGGGATVNCPSGATVGNAGTFNDGDSVFWIFISGDGPTYSGGATPPSGGYTNFLAIVPTTYASRYASFIAGTCPSCQFNPAYLTAIAPFRVLRDMDWENTNANFGTVTWATRPMQSEPFYGGTYQQQQYGNSRYIQPGVPVEVVTALCNAIQASCWYNIALNASDDYADNLAAYVSANLSQRAFYEYVNEPWNNNSLQTQLENLGATAFSTSASFVAGMSYYEMQASHLMGLITSHSLNNRYYRVLGLGPNQNTQGTTCGNCANWWWLGGSAQGNLWSGWSLSNFDVVTLAPYFGYSIPDAWGASALLGNLFTEITNGGIIPSSSGASATTNSGNNYTLTSSSACGAGALSSPVNGSITCFKANATSTGNSKLTVDGGTQYPLYYPLGQTNDVSCWNLNSGGDCGNGLTSSSTYYAVFTTTTGATAWAAGTTYAQGFPVVGSDGNTYVSVAGSNTGNNPVGDGGVHWTAITPAWWLCFCGSGGMVAGATTIVTQTQATLSSLSVSLPMVGYESGQQIVEIADTFTLYTLTEAQNDARWVAVYLNYYGALKTAGFTGVINHYNDIGVWSIFGSWGFSQNLYNAPVPKQTALDLYIQQNPKLSLPFLLNRDLPGHPANDDRPVGLNEAA